MSILDKIWYQGLRLHKRFSSDSEVIPEVFENYLNIFKSLELSGRWYRDADFIIGEIKLDDEILMIQADSAVDFVEMVNDVIVAAHDVPLQYVKHLERAGGFSISRKEFEKLNNAAVKKSTFHITSPDKRTVVA